MKKNCKARMKIKTVHRIIFFRSLTLECYEREMHFFVLFKRISCMLPYIYSPTFQNVGTKLSSNLSWLCTIIVKFWYNTMKNFTPSFVQRGNYLPRVNSIAEQQSIIYCHRKFHLHSFVIEEFYFCLRRNNDL